MKTDELIEQVELLQRQIERERKARKETEAILEEKSLALYTANQRLTEFTHSLANEIEKQTTELRQARDEALAHSKAKTDFLANMSHEIRTPLNGVLGMLYSLRKCKSEMQRQSLIKSAIESGKLLLEIINDILDFSKIESIGIQLEDIEFDLRHTIETVVHNFAVNARKKGLDIITEIDAKLPNAFLGDGFRIQQVLGNLISNSIKFTEKGHIIVSANVNNDGSVLISVTDTGIGIDEENLSKIFFAFDQADNSITRNFGGSGLGLAICSRIAEAMNTEIKIDSQKNVGTTFHFTLKLPVIDPTNLTHLCGNKLEKFSIFLISASERYRIKIEKIFQNLKVHHYESFDNLKQIDIKEWGKHEHLTLLLDLANLRPEDVNSWKKIKKDNPEIHIIILENYEDIMDFTRSADAHLLKPVRSRELIKTIIDPTTQISAINPNNDNTSIINGTKILVVDDNDINLKVATTILTDLGCKVKTCSSGELAIEMVQNNRFDLIFMDIQMPEMDGMSTTRAIRSLGENYKALPIVAMTAHAQEENRKMYLASGLDEHVPKPIDPESLIRTISRFISKPKIKIQPNSEPQSGDSASKEARKLLSAIDLNSALQRLGGREELLKTLLNDFFKEFNTIPNIIEVALKQENTEELCRKMHTIKGSGGNLGLTKISEAAAAIEKHLKEKGSNVPSAMIQNFKQCMTDLDSVKDWIKQTSMKNLNQQSSNLEISPKASPPVIVSAIEQLKILSVEIKKDIPTAQNIVEQLSNNNHLIEFDSALEIIRNHLDNFDIEKAIYETRVLAKKLESRVES